MRPFQYDPLRWTHHWTLNISSTSSPFRSYITQLRCLASNITWKRTESSCSSCFTYSNKFFIEKSFVLHSTVPPQRSAWIGLLPFGQDQQFLPRFPGYSFQSDVLLLSTRFSCSTTYRWTWSHSTFICCGNAVSPSPTFFLSNFLNCCHPPRATCKSFWCISPIHPFQVFVIYNSPLQRYHVREIVDRLDVAFLSSLKAPVVKNRR